MLPPGGFEFGPFHLDMRTMRLFRNGTVVPMPARHITLLTALVSRAGLVVSKDELIRIGWEDVSATDNSLAQAVTKIRRALAAHAIDADRYITTEAGQGYRFTATTTRTAARGTDADIDEVLAPHRAASNGRALLEALRIDGLAGARSTYEALVLRRGDDPRSHIGLANACLEEFEATRADPQPDTALLARAATHAREGVRLNLQYADAWVALGLVLARTGDRTNAHAAFRQAMTLEPNEWIHPLGLAWIAWGRERLRAAARVLELMPGHPSGHWLAATV